MCAFAYVYCMNVCMSFCPCACLPAYLPVCMWPNTCALHFAFGTWTRSDSFPDGVKRCNMIRSDSFQRARKMRRSDAGQLSHGQRQDLESVNAQLEKRIAWDSSSL